jgi:hypothetical protein
MAGQWSDRDVALTLNRLRLRSGTGLTWTEQRVYAVRPLEQTSKILGVSNTVVRRLINDGLHLRGKSHRFGA